MPPPLALPPSEAWQAVCRRALCCQEPLLSRPAPSDVPLWGQIPQCGRPQHVGMAQELLHPPPRHGDGAQLMATPSTDEALRHLRVSPHRVRAVVVRQCSLQSTRSGLTSSQEPPGTQGATPRPGQLARGPRPAHSLLRLGTWVPVLGCRALVGPGRGWGCQPHLYRVPTMPHPPGWLLQGRPEHQ